MAEAVVSAIRQDQYYVIPAQAGLLDLVDLHMQDILARRNPTVAAPSA